MGAFPAPIGCYRGAVRFRDQKVFRTGLDDIPEATIMN
jgi:hypothetical protein